MAKCFAAGILLQVRGPPYGSQSGQAGAVSPSS